jgi:hypothetical protein
MTTPKLSMEQRAAIERDEQRVMSPAEFAARAAMPMSSYERESFDDLVAWFTRRYPTAGERLRAIRIRVQRHRLRG